MAFPDSCVEDTRNTSSIPVITTETRGTLTLNESLRSPCPPGGPAYDLSVADSIRFIAKESRDATVPYINVPCTLVDSTTLTLMLTSTDLPYAGMWEAGYVLLDTAGDVIAEFKRWLIVKKSLTHTIRKNSPMEPDDVREFLIDRCPTDNFLLAALEFSDAQIADCAQRAVAVWNETPPSVASYTVATFPFKYHLTVGTAAQLLRSAALNYSRNHLQFNGGGVSVDDKNKMQEYLALSKELSKEYTEWATAKAVEMNLNLCYGGLGSAEFRGGRMRG